MNPNDVRSGRIGGGGTGGQRAATPNDVRSGRTGGGGGKGGQHAASPQLPPPGGIPGSVTADSFDASRFGKSIGAATENAFSAGNQVFDKSLYAGFSPQTTEALDKSATMARDIMARSAGPSLTEQNLKGVADGQYLAGANPFFEANLAKAKDSTYADVMASLGSTGRTGSNIHMDELTGALGNLDNSARGAQYETERDRQLQALGVIEQQRQQGITNGMAGSAALLQGGQMRDADAQARLMADYDLFQRKDPYSHVAKYMGLLSGAQGTQGIQREEPETPWWQTLLGGAATVASFF